jgi:cysteine sulfinate desulfinase/cysteine desulfurase-like protein
VPPEAALGAVRFSLGRWTTKEEIDWVVLLLTRQPTAYKDVGCQN